MRPSKRAESMPRSAIRMIMRLASERPSVIHLEVGEPEFGTPIHIIEGAMAAARDGFTKYTSNAGLPDLRAKIAARAGSRMKTAVSPDSVVVTSGAVESLFCAIMAVVDPGDEILVPEPGWPNYKSMAHLASAVPVAYQLPADDGFLPDFADVEAKITSRTRAIVINTPANPTGAVFPRRVMERFSALARERDLFIISDEIYEDVVFEGEHVSIGELGPADRVFVVSGASKSYAMTGWRLGWVLCPEELAAVAGSIQEPITSCAPSVSQKAAEVALAGDQSCVDELRATYRKRRNIVAEIFDGTALLPLVPKGAFYALIRTGRDSGSIDFAKQFLLERGVAVVPGVTFGDRCDHLVRIAFTTDDASLWTGLTELRKYIG